MQSALADETADHRYLQFVYRYIIEWDKLVDPFACHWPLEHNRGQSANDHGYYGRDRIHKDILKSESRIFIGKVGIGKSVLFHQFPFGQDLEALIVKLSLQNETDRRFTIEDLAHSSRPSLHQRKIISQVYLLVDNAEAWPPEEVMEFVLRTPKMCGPKIPAVWFKIFVDSAARAEFEKAECVQDGTVSRRVLPSWDSLDIEGLLEKRILDYRPGEPAPGSPATSSYQALRKQLTRVFSKDELRTLCHDLDVEYENLPNTRDGLVRELIRHMENLQRIDDLIQCAKDRRPKIDWESLIRQPTLETDRFDWVRDIPDSALDSNAKRQFINSVVEGAKRANRLKNEASAPVHALRLARFLLLECANRHYDENSSPLTVAQIEALINTYWNRK